MESLTYFKNVKISPRKLRFLLPSIKKAGPILAMEKLYYSNDKAGRFYYKALKSAITNARQTLKAADDLLQFKLLAVEEGNKLKRFHPGGRGTAKPYTKRFSHLKIIIVSREKEEKKKVEGLLPLKKAEKKVTSEVKEIKKVKTKTAVKTRSTKLNK